MDSIQVKKQFNVPIATIFELLAQHDTYNQIFAPAQIVKIKDSNDVLRPDGVGSIRQVKLGVVKLLKEQITLLEVNKRIEYTVIQNTLIQHHLGIIEFEALNDAQTLVTYTIQLTVGVPFIGKLILNQLKGALKGGFSKLAKSI